MKKTKEKGGITLIALVVTIVILLILAGISINLVLGNNGIISRAKDARISSEIAKVQDALDFKISENDIDRAIGDSNKNVYKIDGFVQETKVNDGGEEKDIYIIKDLSKIGTSSTIGKGSIPDKSDMNLSDLRDNLIIDQDNKIYYIDKNGDKFGKDTINGFKKVVGSSSEWVVEYQPQYGNTIVKYLGNDNDIVIPNYVDDVKIDSIGMSLFNNSTITGTLTISEGIENIGEWAFSSSKFSGNLVIPDSIKKIENSAFAGCNFEGTLIIGKNVEEIEAWAFAGCKNFSGLILGKKVMKIGGNAFDSCTGFSGNLIIEEGVRTIDAAAFQGCKGFNGYLTLKEGVKEIKQAAFQWCNFCGDLIIPDTVDTIEENAFAYCKFDGKLYLPNSVKNIGNDPFISAEFNGIFIDTDVVNMDNLTPTPRLWKGNLQFGDNVKEIAYQGVAGFENLTGDLIIPNSVTKIGDSAFIQCTGFDKNLVIGDGIIEIPDYAFNGFSFKGTLTIGKNVKKIGANAFKGCSQLTGDLIIPDSVTTIGNEAFSGCSGLNGKIKIGNHVTSIGGAAFVNCSGLTGDLIIPSSVSEMIGSCFNGCSGLNGTLVLKISQLYKAFNGRCNMKNVIIIDENIENISAGTFSVTYALESCYIPSGLIQHMSQYTFGGASSSAKIYTDATVADSSWQEGWNSYGGGNLEVVYNTSLEQYKTLYNIEY